MPDWVGWAGLVGTFVFGILSVWQLIQYLVDRRVRDANKKHLLAMKNQLQSLRQNCADETPDASGPVRQWINHMSLTMQGIEHHIDAMMETQGSSVEREASKRFQKELNKWITSGNELIQQIIDDPGVVGPSNEKQPSQEIMEAAETWVCEARNMIKGERPELAGQFDNVVDFVSLSWSGFRRFNAIIEPVAARVKRLGEFQQRG